MDSFSTNSFLGIEISTDPEKTYLLPIMHKGNHPAKQFALNIDFDKGLTCGTKHIHVSRINIHTNENKNCVAKVGDTVEDEMQCVFRCPYDYRHTHILIQTMNSVAIIRSSYINKDQKTNQYTNHIIEMSKI